MPKSVLATCYYAGVHLLINSESTLMAHHLDKQTNKKRYENSITLEDILYVH